MAEMVSEAVEADTFLRIYEAVEVRNCKVSLVPFDPELLITVIAMFQDSSRKIQVPVRHLCAIRKVVWSSFDYMTGPELGFTWEAVTATSESTSKSSMSDSSRDDSSLTSSVTKGCGSGADYEEIDDVYRVSYLLSSNLPDLVLKSCLFFQSFY